MYSSIEGTHDYIGYFKEQIEKFGGINSRNKKEKYVFRNNANADKGAFFGCICEGEAASGPYSDLSIVVFPSDEKDDAKDRWIIALGVGSLGFKNDYDLVSLPGTRRAFVKHLKKDANKFIKNDFMDIENDDGFSSFCERKEISDTLKNAVNSYKKVLLTATLFDPNDYKAGKKLISKYLAIYAKLRQWPTNDGHRNDVGDALLANDENDDKIDESNVDESNVRTLLEKRKYVVLQGAPGTGKTRLAKWITSDTDKENIFFTQFHAETTYSDFVYGIIPNAKDKEKLIYTEREGKFVKAINKAIDNPNKKIYLIIDEINRANLSNVLGPSFYLFEPTMTDSDVEIEVCPGLKLKKLPDNLYVIATMNTADRSLAVVDFALRRRFAWYTLFPHDIEKSVDEGKVFRKEEFNAIADIFEKYASDEELNLQPGHAYFIVSAADEENEIENRLRYEVMPLIKEYLLDGMLARAKDDFVNYFREEIHEEMFK